VRRLKDDLRRSEAVFRERRVEQIDVRICRRSSLKPQLAALLDGYREGGTAAGRRIEEMQLRPGADLRPSARLLSSI